MKSGYYQITSNEVVWINDVYKSLQATYFDKVFLNHMMRYEWKLGKELGLL